ncbi:hypothetical protein NIES3974_21650 [Calothrix sp. NIES-3974]|nr:hypothetical protein NIES3974_21650 [Calothrix sp. NIES-3974]
MGGDRIQEIGQYGSDQKIRKPEIINNCRDAIYRVSPEIAMKNH